MRAGPGRGLRPAARDTLPFPWKVGSPIPYGGGTAEAAGRDHMCIYIYMHVYVNKFALKDMPFQTQNQTF